MKKRFAAIGALILSAALTLPAMAGVQETAQNISGQAQVQDVSGQTQAQDVSGQTENQTEAETVQAESETTGTAKETEQETADSGEKEDQKAETAAETEEKKSAVKEEIQKVEDVKDVASSIKEVLVAATQLIEADQEDIDRLQDYIDQTRDSYQALSSDARKDLRGSYQSLKNAEAAVQSMDDALSGDKNIEENDKPNSFRYINGQPIKEAIRTVNLEGEESTGQELDAVKGEEAVTGISSGARETALLQTSASGAFGIRAKDMSTASVLYYDGIDVSERQEDIDWAKVKNSGVKFVILRCGYGSNYSSQDDKKWERNVAACEKYNIPYGVYLYSYANSLSKVDSEVKHTLRLLEGHKPQLPVFYDIEENKQFALGASTISRYAVRYCRKIASAGYKAGLYASQSYYEDYFGAFASHEEYYHWVAAYNKYRRCGYSGRYEGFQYSSSGSVPGITSGSVDMDYWYQAIPGVSYSNKEAARPVKTVDLSGVSFNNKTVSYDGKNHALPKVKNLPSGVKVHYSISGSRKDIGVYTVTASFTPSSSSYALVNAGARKASLTITVRKGAKYTSGGLRYKITSAKTNGSGCAKVYAPVATTYSSIRIPSSVKIGGVWFKVTAIAMNSFRDNVNLTSVVIGNNVQIVGAGSFRSCPNLRTVRMGTAVKSIRATAFYGDGKLIRIRIRSAVLESVSKNAFRRINSKARFYIDAQGFYRFEKLFTSKAGKKTSMKLISY